MTETLTTINIALVDDHPFFRDGLKRALQKIKDVKLVAQGASAADACRIAREQRPDIMLLDITMPGNGIDAARAINAEAPSVNIIFLTGSDDDEDVATAIAAGARGYVLKGADAAELVTAIRTVMSGKPYVTPSLSMRMLFEGSGSADASQISISRLLSPRELEILDRATEGKSNADIARELGIAQQTVKNAMSRVLDKLNVRNRVEAVALRLKGR